MLSVLVLWGPYSPPLGLPCWWTLPVWLMPCFRGCGIAQALCDPASSAQPLAFGVEKSRSCSEKAKSGGVVVAFGGFTLVLQGDISPWCSYLLHSHLFSWTTSWPCAFCSVQTSARWPRASSSQASHSQSSFCFGCLSPLKWGASITMDPPVTRREHIP